MMTRICSSRSTSPRRREASSLTQGRTISINRAPVLTLWAAVVAERLGFDRDAALTLGRAVAGLNAYAKGVSLGLFEPSSKAVDEHFEKAKSRRHAEGGPASSRGAGCPHDRWASSSQQRPADFVGQRGALLARQVWRQSRARAASDGEASALVPTKGNLGARLPPL